MIYEITEDFVGTMCISEEIRNWTVLRVDGRIVDIFEGSPRPYVLGSVFFHPGYEMIK